jgi:hypothetical protein
MKKFRTTLAHSNNDKCIKILLYVLEQKFPNYEFHLYNGYTSSIYVYNIDKSISNEIISYCEGYVSGWDDATE